jgi:hypothetical protein
MRIFRVLRDKPRMTWNQLMVAVDPFLFFWSCCLVLQVAALIVVLARWR